MMKGVLQGNTGFQLYFFCVLPRGKRLYFFCRRRNTEKISTLKPLTDRTFAVPLRRRQRGTGLHPVPRRRPLHSTAKPAPLAWFYPKVLRWLRPRAPGLFQRTE